MGEQAFSTGEPAFFTVGERGVLVRIKAKPHAREDAVVGVRGGELLVSVRAAPEKGRANEEIIRVVASAARRSPRERDAEKRRRISSQGAAAPPRGGILAQEAWRRLTRAGRWPCSHPA